MDKLIPWKKLEQQLIKKYHKGKKRAGLPYPLPVMLRVHAMQLFYNLSDPAMEDALYEIESMRQFAGLRLSGNLPDETTILNFRHFLEEHKFGKMIFKTINGHLAEQGLILREGSIVDATILSAPSSTKNSSGERDPEMYQTKKGNQWHFGMKMHIGTDDAFGLIHSIATTSANVHDIAVADQFFMRRTERVWGDAGYLGIGQRPEHQGREVDWQIGPCVQASERSFLKAIRLQNWNDYQQVCELTKLNTASSTSSESLGTTKCATEDLPRTPSGFIYLPGSVL